MKARWLMLAAALLAAAQTTSSPDRDTDRDGLSDYSEIHKYRTDPQKAATAEGIPDGDWDQRKEFTYSITSVLQIAKPYNVADMTDDYQDARLISEDAGSATVEVVYYPLNTNRAAIGENTNWRHDYAGMRQYLQPTATENWDDKMRADLIAALKADGIDPDQLTDRQLVTEVSHWVMKRSRTTSAFSIWFVHFPNGLPEVFPALRAAFDRQKPDASKTDAAMFEEEVLGRSMFYNRVHGSCTSSAVLMATVMRALGIPTRIVFTIPPLDANDPKQRQMMLSAVRNNAVRSAIRHGLPDGHGGFSNHIFNEVFVGNRWVRLNYDVLGQNILDGDFFGLLTHILTTDSVSHVPMHETWGRRIALYPKVGPALSSVNPYRLLEVSDHFGKFANVPNPEVENDELRRVTVNQAFWIDAPPKGLAGKLAKAADKTDFFIGIREYIPGFRLQLREFLQHAGKQFVLEAAGHPTVTARANGWNITAPGEKNPYQLFAMRIDPEDRDRVAAGVAYQIRPVNDNETYVWTVQEGVTLEQTATAFDAASVKISTAAEGSSTWNSHPGYLEMRNQTLQRIVAIAYGIKDERNVIGGPGWVSSDRFDITARAAGPAEDSELLQMLQTLLARRFHLVVRRESKTDTGLALVQTKDGLKIQPDETEGPHRSNSTRGKIVAQRISMSNLANTLARTTGTPVIDQTGAEGLYSFTLEWDPDSLDEVLASRLGLKLENKKMTVDGMVIDRAERPSEN